MVLNDPMNQLNLSVILSPGKIIKIFRLFSDVYTTDQSLNQSKQVHHWKDEKQAIKTIQNAAMPGKNVS